MKKSFYTILLFVMSVFSIGQVSAENMKTDKSIYSGCDPTIQDCDKSVCGVRG